MFFLHKNIKGLSLCLFLTFISFGIQGLESYVLNMSKPIIDVLIIALLAGILVNNIRFPMPRIFSKTDDAPKFVSKQLLEFAVILLGFNVNFSIMKESGIPLIILSVLSVLICLPIVFLICKKLFKLDKNISLLVAAGNAICGNSAVAAIASVIKARPSHVAIAISFSAVIGLAQVILLPLISIAGLINDFQYGILVGLSVYAVPQVVAASFVISPEAGLIATQVKLLRVLMLGPVIFGVTLLTRNKKNEKKSILQNIFTYIPWFVAGFIVASIIGSLNLISKDILSYVNQISKFFFAVAMTGIGLSVSLKDLKNSAREVAVSVIAATTLMIIIAVSGIYLLDLK